MRQETISGIILQSKNMFEHDKLVDILTPTHGRLRVLVKYANSRRSSLKGKLDPTYHVSMVVSQGKSFMWSSQVDMVQGFSGIRESFNRISLACYMMQVLKSATVENQASPGLFSLLKHQLECLDRGKDLDTVQQEFQLSFLHEEGLSIQQDTISFTRFKNLFEDYCGKQIEKPVFI